MASVLHKTADPTDYRTSVHTPDFPSATWFINPDVSAVESVPTKYWARPLTDPVTEMTQGEKDAVDAAIDAALVAASRAEAVDEPDAPATAGHLGVRTRALIELFNKRDTYLVNRIIELQDRVQAMLDSNGAVANMRIDGLAVPISASATRTKAAAITDYKADINAGNQDT
jgi:hypothetical protein